MNSYSGMTMVEKERGQDDYFSQQSILLTITNLHKSYTNYINLLINLLHSQMEHLNWQTSGSFELGVEYNYNKVSCESSKNCNKLSNNVYTLYTYLGW